MWKNIHGSEKMWVPKPYQGKEKIKLVESQILF